VEGEDFYTTGQAARILRVTDRAIRKMIDWGELEARQDDRGRHRIPQRAVHTMLDERRGRAEAVAELTEEAPGAAQEAAELRRRVETSRGSSGAWSVAWSLQSAQRVPCERSAWSSC
jgi:excisionase family DNA binding protein